MHALKLPYNEGRLSMMLILPDERDAIEEPELIISAKMLEL